LIIKEHYSLKLYNTFGIDVEARYFVQVTSTHELVDFLEKNPLKNQLKLILGGGSNMLLTQNIDGVVLHVAIKGKKIIAETKQDVVVESGAGENWHEMVMWCIDQNLGGIENLSLIPGNAGTAPVQNIGAYGVEIKDTFESLDAIEIATGHAKSFTRQQCNFGYRNSIFKLEVKGKYIITSVRLKLSKAPHQLSTHYGAIKDELLKQNVSEPTIRDISNAVIAIRKSKLPDPAEIGNSGSFFKNPILPSKKVDSLKKQHPELPVYPADQDHQKIAAGWLIEQAGLKGIRKGDAGIHKKQALVLVNYGNASGQDLLSLAHDVIQKVEAKFGVVLEPEVNVI
jgi:UDP-N-acetylmuramate dehydrogenase